MEMCLRGFISSTQSVTKVFSVFLSPNFYTSTIQKLCGQYINMATCMPGTCIYICGLRDQHHSFENQYDSLSLVFSFSCSICNPIILFLKINPKEKFQPKNVNMHKNIPGKSFFSKKKKNVNTNVTITTTKGTQIIILGNIPLCFTCDTTFAT